MGQEKKLQKIVENIGLVRKKIDLALQESGRAGEKVLLVVVTKNQPKELIAELIARCPGLHIGENRISEAKEKKAFFDDFSGKDASSATKNLDYFLHFIGRLQTNKVKDFLKISNIVHSLDRYSVIDEIERRLDADAIVHLEESSSCKNLRTNFCTHPHPRKVKGFLQLNVSGEESKAGFDLAQMDAMDAFLPKIAATKNIDFIGLMTMAPQHDDALARQCFHSLKKAREQIATKISDWVPPSEISRFCFSELSMGMSGDYETAVRQGATCVRVGSAIFDF